MGVPSLLLYCKIDLSSERLGENPRRMKPPCEMDFILGLPQLSLQTLSESRLRLLKTQQIFVLSIANFLFLSAGQHGQYLDAQDEYEQLLDELLHFPGELALSEDLIHETPELKVI